MLYRRMTKRNNSFEQNPPKRSKLDLDDLWGEEFDEDEIEACVLRATQVYQHDNLEYTQINNISLLPSYDHFKEVNNQGFTSTQKPSTSRELPNNQHFTKNMLDFKGSIITRNEDDELRIKLNQIENELKAKDGENSILRSRLNTLQLNMRSDHESKLKEINLKHTQLLKELKACKSELQYKDLEITNLKGKLLEISTSNLHECNSSDQPSSKKIVLCNTPSIAEEQNFKLRPNTVIEFPLKNKIDSSIFKIISGAKFKEKIQVKHEDHSTIYETSHNEILESHMFLKENENFSLELVFSDMAFLINCTEEQINDKMNCHHVKNILILFKLLLSNLHKFFLRIKRNISSEAIRIADMKYLEKRIPALNVTTTLFDPAEWCENEIGIRLRQLMACIGELLPYSTLLKQDILDRKHPFLKHKYPEESGMNYGFQNLQSIANLDALSLISSCVSDISSMRKAKNCIGFLCSTLHLLCKICSNSKSIRENNFVNCAVTTIIKEIIRNRPNELVLYHLSNFMKQNALNPYFIDSLCNMTRTSLRKNSKQIIYFDSSSCVFQVFNVLYTDWILNGDNNSLLIDTNMNMMKFFANMFNTNIDWLQYNENRCVCLTKLIELIVAVTYSLIKYCDDETVTDLRLMDVCTLTIQILSFINVKYNDIIENYLHICSKFRAIAHMMQGFGSNYIKKEDNILLNQLLIYEDISDVRNSINEKNFGNIHSWIE